MLNEVANSPILWIGCSAIILFALAHAAVFMYKGWKEALRLGVSRDALKRTVRVSASVSIIPTIPIIISVFVLVPILGIPIPWLRLSVVGSAIFETSAAAAATNAVGAEFTVGGLPASDLMSVFFGMAIAGSCPALLSLFAVKPISNVLVKTKSRDMKWMTMLSGCAFAGLLTSTIVDQAKQGLLPFIVLVVSAVSALLLSKLQERVAWLKEFTTSFAMIIAMIAAFFLGNYVLV